MTELDEWQRYLSAVQTLHDIRRSIAAIGTKQNPTQEELDNLADLLDQHDEAEQAVIESSYIGREGVARKGP